MPRESRAAKAERLAEILRRLEAMYPDSRCSLTHDNPYQLAVATVLSAQCTDARVNASTPELFERYPTPDALANAPTEEVEEIVRPLGFFRNKARSIIGLAQGLVERHGGEIPRSMDELTALPGIGRKTANVVLGVAFGQAEGVVVDTHVKRIANRLDLTRHTDPGTIEQDLLKILPEEQRVIFTHRIIDHGRAICTARNPKCWECPLAELCPAARVVPAPKRASS